MRLIYNSVMRDNYWGWITPHAAAIADLGGLAFSQGKGVDAALAQPLYVRDKVALKTLEREAIAQAKLDA